MPLLTPRATYAPFEYDQAYKYWELQQQSHWLHTEVSMASDINDWKLVLTESEKQVIGTILKGFTQSEVFIQEYWSQMVAKWFKKPEIQMMAGAFGSFECFDKESELLCDIGWVSVKEITQNHQVAQYDLLTSEISFDRPSQVMAYYYEGKMHQYLSQSIDMCVTPNHDLILRHPASKVVKKAKSSDGVWGNNYSSPVAGRVKKRVAPLTPMERILIALQADGCMRGMCPKSSVTHRTCDLHLTKQSELDRAERLLQDAGIKYSKIPKRNSRAFVLSFCVPDWVDISKIRTFGLFDLSSFDTEKARQFIEEVSYWDFALGTTKTKRTSIGSYYNTNRCAIDFVQALCVIAGYSCKTSINRKAEDCLELILPNGKKPKTAKDCFVASISKKEWSTLPHRKEIDYSDNVYCVSVSKGNVISRRNGRVVVTGNSIHAVSYAYLNQSLGLEDFSAFLQEPTAKAKIDRLITTKGKSKSEIALSLAIFSAFNEGVSLFSSFAVLLNFSRFNRLKGLGQIIAFSIKDETLHSSAGCWLFRTLIEEYPDIWTDELKKEIYEAARLTIELEDDFIDKAFELGPIEGLDPADLKVFIRHRANTKLIELGLKKNWKALSQEAFARMEWFDVLGAGVNHADFFSGRNSDYSKGQDFTRIWD